MSLVEVLRALSAAGNREKECNFIGAANAVFAQ
jgi:hypothetical protein